MRKLHENERNLTGGAFQASPFRYGNEVYTNNPIYRDIFHSKPISLHVLMPT